MRVLITILLSWALYRYYSPSLSQSFTMSPPFNPQAFVTTLNAKIRANTPLTTCETRFLLRTGFLPYKALLFPETLTPAEHNRILNRPSPEEVTRNIRTVTSNSLSTPEELLQKATSSAPAMSDDELKLIVHAFYLADSVYKTTGHLSWVGKLGDMGDLAMSRVQTEEDRIAGNKAWEAYEEETRVKRRMEGGKKIGNGEERRRYHAEERKAKEVAAADKKRLEEEDVMLFGEARGRMEEMAAGFDKVRCGCDLCKAEGERFRKGDARLVTAEELGLYE